MMSLEQLAVATSDVATPAVPSRRDCVLLRWPDQEERRRRLAAEAVPRLLLISRPCSAPVCTDELEDWAREPLDPAELDLRAARLAHRARLRALRPRVDDSDLVRVGDRWVDLPTVQLPVAQLLVARFGCVVAAEQIRAAYRTAGGSTHPKAVRAMIGRVKRRLAQLDLVLVNVRDRGYLLESLEPAGRAEVQLNRQE